MDTECSGFKYEVTPVRFGNRGSSIYRAYRYGLDHPAVAHRDLTPDAYKQLNASLGLM